MELSGADENDIPWGDRTFFKINGNDTPPFFNNDQFKLRMPVQRNLRKILWDWTEICIVRKFCCGVWFSFTVILIFIQIHGMPLSKKCITVQPAPFAKPRWQATVQSAPFAKPHDCANCGFRRCFAHKQARSSSDRQSSDSYASINPSPDIRWLNCWW